MLREVELTRWREALALPLGVEMHRRRVLNVIAPPPALIVVEVASPEVAVLPPEYNHVARPRVDNEARDLGVADVRVGPELYVDHVVFPIRGGVHGRREVELAESRRCDNRLVRGIDGRIRLDRRDPCNHNPESCRQQRRLSHHPHPAARFPATVPPCSRPASTQNYQPAPAWGGAYALGEHRRVEGMPQGRFAGRNGGGRGAEGVEERQGPLPLDTIGEGVQGWALP
mmetsp:Transcript_7266/g.16894  ORF Transcript_7266/g.16894 Transcript_7266/m.16894 type:complete len:228 (+) Transcript_7266:1329-2012(+)